MSVFPSLDSAPLPGGPMPEGQGHDTLFQRTLWATALVLALVVGASVIGWALGGAPEWLGIRPRQPLGWVGIVSTVFVHADLEHLAANALGLGVGVFILLAIYPTVALRVMLWVVLVGGLGVYVFGRCCVHIGASGLIYGIEAFLLVSGLVRLDKGAIAVALIVVFLSPGLLWGMTPLQPVGTSWEGHLYGGLAGALLALRYRRYDRPAPVRYSWEDEHDTPDEDNPEPLLPTDMQSPNERILRVWRMSSTAPSPPPHEPPPPAG
ncbi:MAG: rhomboid family intramembrane serine protease [Bacteroidia bacterium]|nr:rhomboid family intramembrane serine protease [Bacteroidia bacterium]